MKLPKFEFADPDSMAECCRLLSEKGERARIIAGGTDLLMAMKNRSKMPELLVDLCRVPDLNRISYSEREGLKAGAMVTLRHFANEPIVREKFPLLSQAALAVGDAQLQAMGTIGGNLCQDCCCLYYNRPPMLRQNYDPCHKLGGQVCHAVKGSKSCWATYSGDLAPALLVLQARIKISGSQGEKITPLKELFSGDGKNPHILSPDQVVTEILVPPPAPRSGGAYLKMRVRKTIDYPLLGVAVYLTLNQNDGFFDNISVALTGVDMSPVLIDGAEWLSKSSTSQEIIEKLVETAYRKARPVNNTFGYSPRYRREMVKTYVKSAVRQSVAYAEKQGGTV